MAKVASAVALTDGATLVGSSSTTAVLLAASSTTTDGNGNGGVDNDFNGKLERRTISSMTA